MATKVIAWETGTGNITLTYTGDGDGTIRVESDANNLATVRSQEITVRTTDGSNISRTVTIRQAARVLNYLKFTALESGTFSLNIPANIGSDVLSSVSYSIDNGSTWTTTANSSSNVTITTPTISNGGTVLWKGNGVGLSTDISTGNYSNFTSTCRFDCEGNIMSLLYGDNFENQKKVTANYAFSRLFYGCTTIISADILLPALYITEGCYRDMFNGCTSLAIFTGDLVAKYAPAQSYRSMFADCTSLGIINSTVYAKVVGADGCRYMCGGCSNLSVAPVLLATTIESSSYIQTFYNCSSLAYIEALIINSPSSTSVSTNFTSGVAASGVFVKSVYSAWPDIRGANGVPYGWDIETVAEPHDYLTFRFVENGTFYFKTDNESFVKPIMYKKNDGEWTSFSPTLDGTVCSVVNGDIIKVRGTNTQYSDSLNKECFFATSGRAYISGDVDSLINFNHKAAKWCFHKLFQNCTNIDIEPNGELLLPSMSVLERSYSDMFSGCSSLTRTPEVPATSLGNYCYAGMFIGTAITTPPELKATTLAMGSYYAMFQNCTLLTTAPYLPATTLLTSVYNTMFKGCTSLVNVQQTLPATTLISQCYKQMFYDCANLEVAPVLPAETLQSACYTEMFRGCSKLRYIKAMFTTTPSSSYTSNWVNGVAASGTFVKNSAAEWDVYGNSGIPNNWTVETASS